VASSVMKLSKSATSEPLLARLQALLAALWAGQMLCVAAVAAPSAFAVLERAQAGQMVGRVFALDAQIGLIAGLLLVLLARRAQQVQASGASALSAEVLLPLLAIFCVAAGYYGLQPLMDAARAGQGNWSFGALHGLSTVFFAIKTAAVLALAWRLTGRRAG